VLEFYRHIEDFATPEEVRRFTDLIRQNAALFTETSGRGGLGPRYRIIDGDQIQSQLSDVATFGEYRVRPIVEEFAQQPLHLFGSSKRAMRIQVYYKKHHGFRWHFDGHSYTAFLCLKNTNRGQTQLISSGLSQVLRFLLYPLYALPQVFSIVPYQEITMEAGDLYLLCGSRLLHRGVTLDEEGERILMVYGYDELDKKRNLLRDKIARALNY
jgi:hypothetical protein